jgi:hypothetical protein
MLPFASKELANGKRLYRRKHGYAFELVPGENVKTITVPYNVVKINEIEILNALEHMSVDLKVRDTAAGTYSTVPNMVLNQFGFSVYIRPGRFEDISQYDAELYTGMVLELKFTATIPQTVYVNIVFHEVA